MKRWEAMSPQEQDAYIIVAERGKHRTTRSLSQLVMGQSRESRATLRRLSQLPSLQANLLDTQQQRPSEMSVRRMSLRVTRSPDVEGLLGVTGANTGNREDDDKLFNYLLGRLQAWGHAFSNAPTQMRADYLSWKKDTDRKDKVISSFDNFDAVSLITSLCAPRAVTLMIFPTLTPLSVYAVNSVSSPILLLCDDARRFFPPLFLSNAFELATNDEMQFNHATTSAMDRGVYWAVIIGAIVCKVTHCRAMSIVMNLFKFGMVFGLLYGNVNAWLIVSFVILMPIQFIENLTIYTLIGRRVGIVDGDLEQFFIFQSVYQWAAPEYAAALEERRQRREARKTAKVQPVRDEGDSPEPQDNRAAPSPDQSFTTIVTSCSDRALEMYRTARRMMMRGLNSLRKVHTEDASDVVAAPDRNTKKVAPLDEHYSEEQSEGKRMVAYARERQESRGNALQNEMQMQRLQSQHRLRQRLKARKKSSAAVDDRMDVEGDGRRI